MNLDELRSVQNREREAASLQNLRPTFYEDAGRFIGDLEAERDRAAERADDPFASPEVRRLTDDIETAKSTVEAIYERRVGKVVKMASIAAAEMPTEEENLTNEERDLFETLVDRITANREHVLEGVLEGDGPGLTCSRDLGDGTEAATDPTGSSDASSASSTEPTSAGTPGSTADADAPADAPAGSFMGGDGPDDGATADDPGPPEAGTTDVAGDVSPSDGAGPDSSASPTAPAAAAAPTDAGPADRADPPAPGAPPSTSSVGGGTDDEGDRPSPPEVDRALVRITSDVGEIFGVDDRAYELSTDEVVTLPEANADPLVEKGAAERLE